MPTERFIFGAGGHAKVVLDTLQRLELAVRVFDGDPARAGSRLLGVEVEHAALDGLPPCGHLAIGNNQVRARLLLELGPHVSSWFSIIHPQASIAASAEMAEGIFVAAQAVVGPQSRIGIATLINHGAVVDHDCTIGRCCHIAPNATLGGAVVVGDGVLVGSGAVLLPGVRIGDNAVIGSGAVVTRSVPANTTVIGVPARGRN